MGLAKDLLKGLLVIAVIWIAIFIFLKFFSSFKGLSVKELFTHTPKYMWEVIKSWVTSV